MADNRGLSWERRRLAGVFPMGVECNSPARRRRSQESRIPHSALPTPHLNMLVIFLLIFISLTLATVFLACFVWAVKSGQFEDTCTPSMRILTDEESPKTKVLSKSNT